MTLSLIEALVIMDLWIKTLNRVIKVKRNHSFTNLNKNKRKNQKINYKILN
jgi:hypothetical protein